MRNNFGFDTEFNKLLIIARNLWMGFGRGEGELEIDNQGRSRILSFLQETVAIGQQTPRIGGNRPKLRFTDTQVSARVSSAGCTLNSDSTPHFFSLEEKNVFPCGGRNQLISDGDGAFKAVAGKLQKQFAKILKSGEGLS